jgi:hypothetical protein
MITITSIVVVTRRHTGRSLLRPTIGLALLQAFHKLPLGEDTEPFRNGQHDKHAILPIDLRLQFAIAHTPAPFIHDPPNSGCVVPATTRPGSLDRNCTVALYAAAGTRRHAPRRCCLPCLGASPRRGGLVPASVGACARGYALSSVSLRLASAAHPPQSVPVAPS